MEIPAKTIAIVKIKFFNAALAIFEIFARIGTHNVERRIGFAGQIIKFIPNILRIAGLKDK